MKSTLSKAPQRVERGIVYFEQEDGLLVSVDREETDGRVRTAFTVPWAKVRASVKRQDTGRAKR